MSEGLNRVMLLGNLAADPEFRMTQGGRGVLNLRLATNESYLDRDKQRKERTDFHNIVIWGKRAEALGKILAKGSSLFVEGSLRTSSYEDRDGQKRYKTEVVANNVLLTGGGGRGRGGDGAEDQDGAGYGGGGRSSGGGGYGRGAAGGGARGQQGGGAGGGYGAGVSGNDDGRGGEDFGGYGGNDDDIPF